MIKVPFMKMPRCCDDGCPFARLRYSTPLSDRRQGWSCQVEFYEKGKYETVREAPFNEHVVPVKCPLIDDEDAESVKDLLSPESEDADADSN